MFLSQYEKINSKHGDLNSHARFLWHWKEDVSNAGEEPTWLVCSDIF